MVNSIHYTIQMVFMSLHKFSVPFLIWAFNAGKQKCHNTMREEANCDTVVSHHFFFNKQEIKLVLVTTARVTTGDRPFHARKRL